MVFSEKQLDFLVLLKRAVHRWHTYIFFGKTKRWFAEAKGNWAERGARPRFDRTFVADIEGAHVRKKFGFEQGSDQ